jgi:hypothetical protein
MLKSLLLLLALSAPARAAATFVQEGGIRLSSAVLSGAVNFTPGPGTNSPLSIAGNTHFYYIRGSTAVYSGTTANGGQSFEDDPGIRLSTMTQPVLAISSITGLSVLPLSVGGFRMFYSAISTNSLGASVYSICSATSADGLNWANDLGSRISGGAGFLGSPSLINLGNNQWRLYYTANTDGGADAANRRLYTALFNSTVLTFISSGPIPAFNSQVGEVAAIQRTDNTVRLYYTAPLTGSTTNSTIISALSFDTNGTAFAAEAGIRVATDSTSGYLSSPYVLRSTETWRWKLYYNYTPFAAGVSTADVFSASAFAPDPISLSPSPVLNTGPVLITISGDNFQGAIPPPTLQLSQGASSLPGTGLTYINDQTLSATFDFTGQSVGLWNLTVTNANLAVTTLANALSVTFPSGSVALTDNLIRPRNGTQTKIVVETYSAGPLTARIYTTTGGLVDTLFDSYAPAGITTLSWGGTTSAGHTVASGVYLLRIMGQKVDDSEKIVVIK